MNQVQVVSQTLSPNNNLTIFKKKAFFLEEPTKQGKQNET